jgi:hypothetical protein
VDRSSATGLTTKSITNREVVGIRQVLTANAHFTQVGLEFQKMP